MFLSKFNSSGTTKKSFISDRLNAVALGIGLLVNIIHWALLYGNIQPSESSILLHYSVVYGPDFVDKSLYAYLIPLTALGFFILNFIISIYFYRREKTSSYFLNFAGIPVQLVFLAATLTIIAINA